MTEQKFDFSKAVCSGYYWENVNLFSQYKTPKFHCSLNVMLHESTLRAPFGQDLVSE